MNDECRKLNVEWEEKNGECHARAIHPSSFILHHSPRRGLSLPRWGGSSTATPSRRRGLSLLEVLVSIAILPIGLLAVASLIPIGKLAMTETNKSDRTGMCGRAGLREVKVRRMLDPNSWLSSMPLPFNPDVPFVIDPLGYANFSSAPSEWTHVGGSTSSIQRISLGNVASEVFRWQDELTYVLPKDMNPPQAGDRPQPVAGNQNEGNFSWFLTVSRVPSDHIVDPSTGTTLFDVPWAQRRQFSVAVVVCWKRAFTTGNNDPNAGETTVSNVTCDSPTGYGGIGIQYSNSTVLPRENQWVLLYSENPTTHAIIQATWYRVVSAGNNGTNTRVSLVGPDWNGDGNGGTGATLVVVKGVTGVYTTTVQLDNDAIWTK